MRRPALGGLLLALLGAALPSQAADGLVVVGAVILDGTAARVEDGVLVVVGDRITAVGPRSHVSIPKGATLVDGRGRFVVRGRAGTALKPGQPADFLLLDRDPVHDPRAADTPYRVVSGGRLLTPTEAAEPRR